MYKEFGENKVIILQAIVNNNTYSITNNVKVNNKTNFKTYWNVIKDNLETNYDKDYLIDTFREFKLLFFYN